MKIYSDLTKSNDVLSNIKIIIDNANKTAHNSESYCDISLFNGLGSLVLLNYYLGIITNNIKYINESRIMLETIIGRIMDANFKNYHSFANGLCGVCWLINFMDKKLNKKFRISQQIDLIIFDSCEKEIKNNNPDFLYGGFGGLVYLLQNAPNKKVLINNIIYCFIQQCIIDNKGLRIKNNMLKDQGPREFDLGMAHGLTGYIIILTEAYKNGYKHVGILIEESIKYIFASIRDNERVLFPGSIIEDEVNKKSYLTRLGWCYGDLSIASMLMTVATVFQYDKYYKLAVEIALHTTSRNTSSLAGITDIYYCHGAANLISTYYRFYIKTGRKEFLYASQTWRSFLLKKISYTDFISSDITKTSSILAGAAGIIMALFYSDYNAINDDWFKCTLINF